MKIPSFNITNHTHEMLSSQFCRIGIVYFHCIIKFCWVLVLSHFLHLYVSYCQKLSTTVNGFGQHNVLIAGLV